MAVQPSFSHLDMSVDMIFLAQDRDKSRAVGNTVKNRSGSTQCGEFFMIRRWAAAKYHYSTKLSDELGGWQHTRMWRHRTLNDSVIGEQFPRCCHVIRDRSWFIMRTRTDKAVGRVRQLEVCGRLVDALDVQNKFCQCLQTIDLK